MSYEYPIDKTEINDMKRYNPNFDEALIEGRSDEDIRKVFKDFYLDNLPIDLLTWMRVFAPKDDMVYKKRKEKALCHRYRDHATVGGRCMGFSLNWKSSHSMCEKCPEFYKNKTYVK